MKYMPEKNLCEGEFWYDEKKIEGVMIDWFKSRGFKIAKETYTRGGVDIKAIGEESIYLVEVKGYPRPKSKNVLRNAQKRAWFLFAIGQICTRMGSTPRNVKYALVFPDFDYYETRSLKLKLGRQRLGLEIFLINEKRELRKLAPNSNKFEKLDWLCQGRLF